MRTRVLIAAVVVALLWVTAPLHSQGPAPCTPLEPATESRLLLASGRVDFDEKDGAFKLGEVGFLLEPGKTPLKEFTEYFRTVPGGMSAKFRLTIEPLPPEEPSRPSSAPIVEGELSWDEDFKMFQLTYGRKQEKSILFFTYNECVDRALKDRLGPVRIAFAAPSSTP